jgi:DNA polymerase-3 subunit alpha
LDPLCQRAAELGMPALAMTDHGVLYGAPDFIHACRAHDLRPIIGCEMYINALAPRSCRHPSTPYHHLRDKRGRSSTLDKTGLHWDVRIG